MKGLLFTHLNEELQLKLQVCGDSGQLLSVIQNFLRGRTQVTKVGCRISQSVSLSIGVFQRSCLCHSCFRLR